MRSRRTSFGVGVALAWMDALGVVAHRVARSIQTDVGGEGTDADDSKACSHVRSSAAGLWSALVMMLGLVRRRR